MAWIKCLMLCVVIILPARCFTEYSLPLFQVDSNLSVQYINLVDAAVILVALFFMVTSRLFVFDSKILLVTGAFAMVNAVMLLGLFLTGQAEYAGELISKTILVGCAGITVYSIDSFTGKQKASVYVISITILITAAFFLSDYEGYALLRRAGSLGFGSNETACFACALLAIALFVTDWNGWLRLGSAVLSGASVLFVASRRGVILWVAILVVWIIYLIFKRKRSRVAVTTFFAVLIVAAVALFLFYRNFNTIVDWIDTSRFFHRLRVAETYYSNYFLDFSDRREILENSFAFFGDHLIFGSFGCDKVIAQGALTHSHNILLQYIITYGTVFGTAIAVFVLVSFFQAIRLTVYYLRRGGIGFGAVTSLFFIVYFLFDSLGYLLWNPKGVFWIWLTIFFIQIEYKKTFSHEAERSIDGQTAQAEEG